MQLASFARCGLLVILGLVFSFVSFQAGIQSCIFSFLGWYSVLYLFIFRLVFNFVSFHFQAGIQFCIFSFSGWYSVLYLFILGCYSVLYLLIFRLVFSLVSFHFQADIQFCILSFSGWYSVLYLFIFRLVFSFVSFHFQAGIQFCIFSFSGWYSVLVSFHFQAGIQFCYDAAASASEQTFGVLTPGFNLLSSLEDFLNRNIPENAHLLANDKLYISITEKKKNRIVSKFESKEHLVAVSRN